MVNGCDSIFIERAGKILKMKASFETKNCYRQNSFSCWEAC